MLRFHIDESAEFALASGLRRQRFDVTTTPPDLPKETSDPDQLAFCLSEQRVIVTRDRDFLHIAFNTSEHAGIAYYQPNTRTYGQIIASLMAPSMHKTHDDMKGRVEYL